MLALHLRLGGALHRQTQQRAYLVQVVLSGVGRTYIHGIANLADVAIHKRHVQMFYAGLGKLDRRIFHHDHELAGSIVSNKAQRTEYALHTFADRPKRFIALITAHSAQIKLNSNKREAIRQLADAVVLDHIVAALAVGQSGLFIDIQVVVDEVAQAAQEDSDEAAYKQEEHNSKRLIQLEHADMFSDHNGLVASWGTDWPVNDTVKYKKETVGLATYIPKKYVVKETSDKENFLYTISAPGKSSFRYYTSFTSCKETFGYPDKEKWFAYVQEWKKALEQPVKITVVKK